VDKPDMRERNMAHTEVFDTRQAAQTYGLSESWLNKLRVTGGGCPYIKAGRRVLYRKSDFAEWVASQLRASTSAPGRKPSEQDRPA